MTRVCTHDGEFQTPVAVRRVHRQDVYGETFLLEIGPMTCLQCGVSVSFDQEPGQPSMISIPFSARTGFQESGETAIIIPQVKR